MQKYTSYFLFFVDTLIVKKVETNAKKIFFFLYFLSVRLFTNPCFSKDIKKTEKPVKLGYPYTVKLGGYLSFGDWGGDYNFLVPYVGFAYKLVPILKSKTLFVELEIGYFLMKAKTDGPTDINIIPSPIGEITTTTHAIPYTVSVERKFDLTSTLTITPKIGIGGMTFYSTSTNGNNGFTHFLVFKPGFDLHYRLNSTFNLLLDNSAIFAFNHGVSYFYMPSLGVSLQF